MAGSRSTEKPVSGRDAEEKRKSKRKVSESEDSSDSESGGTMEVVHERKSKMRQDQMVNKSESKSKVVSSSEDDSSSDEKAAMVLLPSSSTSNTLKKGLIYEDVANKQAISESESKGPILFQKKFSDDDEEKILQVMIREGNDGGKKKFWKLHMDSMGLSIPVDECMLYEKARRLKGGFKKRLINGNDALFNDQERKVFALCDKVWGGKERENLVKNRQSEKKLAPVVVEEDVKKIRKKHKVKINEVAEHSHVKKVANGEEEVKKFNGNREGEVKKVVNGNGDGEVKKVVNGNGDGEVKKVVNGNGEGEVKKVVNGNGGEGEVKKVVNGNGEGEVKGTNYTKFVFGYEKRDAADFPFDEAMKVVPISMRPSFEKMWLDRNETRMELDMKTALVVHRLLEAIRSSSSQA